MVLGSVATTLLGALVATLALLGCGRTQENPQEQPISGASPTMPVGVAGGGAAAGNEYGGMSASGGATVGLGGEPPEPSNGGRPPGDVAPWPSPGCKKLPGQPLESWHSYSVHLTGATLDPSFTVAEHDRQYGVWLPHSYARSQPLPTVFLSPGCRDSTIGSTDYTTSSQSAQDVIVVGLASSPADMLGDCTENTGHQSTEWEYFALVATAIEAAFCVDKDAEVIVGKRSGATVANMLGCYFSGTNPARKFGPNLALRGQLSIAQSSPIDLPECGGPLAGLWMHDTNENTPPLSDSVASFERVLAQNGCTDSVSTDWGADILSGVGCKKYTDCSAKYPMIFCQTTGVGRQSNYLSYTLPAEKQFLAELARP
jgi:poly(3-hydroxybutyrate) depolymerase